MDGMNLMNKRCTICGWLTGNLATDEEECTECQQNSLCKHCTDPQSGLCFACALRQFTPPLYKWLHAGMEETAVRALDWLQQKGKFYWLRAPTCVRKLFRLWVMALRKQRGEPECGQTLEWFELQGWSSMLYATGVPVLRCTPGESRHTRFGKASF